jgi:16S rRNA (cytosine1402-N4)-methyltransferase
VAFEHESVLVAEVLEALSPHDHEVFVDGTVGGGGHSKVLLDAASIRLIGIDRDPDALAHVHDQVGGRIDLVAGTFADLPAILGDLKIAQVDGILLDLGVSSPQLDRAERGFSFAKPGPLDMRMDPTTGETALDLLRRLDVETLGELICELGEERYGKKISRAIKEAVKADRIETTTDLAGVIASVIPIAEQRRSKIHPATRTFQALRIAVNGELEQLERFLAAFPDLLAPGGRCAIISFHSLEDRLVKTRFRDLAWTSSLPPQLAAKAGERTEAVCEIITRKAVFASEDEVARNPRARSARMRACRRTSAPNVQTGR